MGHNEAKSIALGGVLAALAVVIMCLGGIVPIATYVCPMLCALLLAVILRLCGKRIAWTWYAAVSILSLLLGPDKEAAIVFLFLGYYPIIKGWIDRRKLSFLWKLLVFNVSSVAMYAIMIYLFQLEQVISEFKGLGVALTLITLLLGNVALFLLDLVLGRMSQKK